MNKELEIWRFAADKLKKNESVTLLVVAASTGSSPGRKGFKMIVAADDLAGSIGGGVMEVALVELAKGKSEPQIIRQVHRKNSPDSSGMICSGSQTIIFFQLDAQHLKSVRQIVRALKNHQPKTLQISNSDFRVNEIRAENPDFFFKQTSETEFLYREKLGYKNRLYIIGGGHCALALSELMAKMDFHISLFDDRKDLNTLAKNRYVHSKTIIESYDQIADFISYGSNVYVVVMTLGYASDEKVIRNLLEKDFKYLGVLGSRAKMKTLLRKLEKENYPKEKLNRIRTPIGLPINSRTPEEIAVSIAAEIIAVKNASA